MEGLPDFAIPAILSFLEAREFCKCACIAKDWASGVQHILVKLQEDSARARAEMTHEQREYFDRCLMRATVRGSIVDVEAYINSGASMETYTYTRGLGPVPELIVAVEEGHLGIVELLLLRGANMEAKDDNGYTALIWAAQSGHPKILQLLIARGANLEATDERNETALFKAALYNKPSTVVVLISAGAGVNVRSRLGGTALDLAQCDGYLEVVGMLQAAGTWIKF